MIGAIYARKSTDQRPADLARVLESERRQHMPGGNQLYPGITATGPSVKRDMVWQDLLEFGEIGATPSELATRLIQRGRAKGTAEGCAALLRPMLEELVDMAGERQTKRQGMRFMAVRLGESQET
jgi:hypothetical protein